MYLTVYEVNDITTMGKELLQITLKHGVLATSLFQRQKESQRNHLENIAIL